MLRITHKGGGFDPDAHPEHWVSYDIPDHPLEFSPEEVFRAANRVGSITEDWERLPQSWQREIRYQIDQHYAPSMSVGDTIDLYNRPGELLLRWQCDRFGWKTIPPEEVK